MTRLVPLALLAAALVATPVLAGSPLAKRPSCQAQRTPSRDLKRPEPCRRAPIPPVIDQTPMFLASTDGAQPALPTLS